MPQEIVTVDGTSYSLRHYDLGSLAPDRVRIRVEFAAPKHGTELHVFTGCPLEQKRWDGELRLFVRSEAAAVQAGRPIRPVGNTVVGLVEAVGAQVTKVKPGERVFAYGPIREVHDAEERWCWPLGSLHPHDAVCNDPAHVAFVAVRDGNIRIGDAVAVFGLGAIGLMAVQIARAGGARRVIAIDPIAKRREFAAAHGADLVLDPFACDAGFEIKTATGRKGVDVAIETSGNGKALHEAIRCIRQCGTVVHVPWGPKDGSALHLDEEFHLNRPTLVASQCWEGWGNPDRSHPLWDGVRQREAVYELFSSGMITGRGLLSPIVPLEQAAGAFADLLSRPESTIKMGVTIP